MHKLVKKSLAIVLTIAMLLALTSVFAATEKKAEDAKKSETVAAGEKTADESTKEAKKEETKADAKDDAKKEDAEEKPADAEEEKAELPEGSVELTVYHFNDTHGREGESEVDFAKIAGKVKGEKEAGKNVLLLDGGDTLHGRPIANIFEGYSVIEIFNAMGVDASVPGNHDFNYGWQRLLELSAYADYPYLSANVTRENRPLLSSLIIREFDGIKVGVFGLTTPETIFKSHPDNTKGLKFEDDIKTAKAMTEFLESAGCDFIIALGHIGLDGGTEVVSSDIMEAVPGIDLFVDGHSHSKLEKGLKAGNGLIVSANEYANFLGEVKIVIDVDGNKNVSAKLLDKEAAEGWKEDEATKKLIDKYAKLVSKEIDIVIGKTDVDLDGERDDVRTSDTNLGRLIVDALLDTTQADVALSNGGNVRKTIPAGDIKYADILEVMPFGNTVVTMNIKGSDILAALEQSVGVYPETNGGFLHIAGGTYTYDPSKEAGSRIVSAEIGGEAIDKDKVYLLATNDFLAAGGDESPIGKGKILTQAQSLDQVIKEYIEAGAFKITDESRVLKVGDVVEKKEAADEDLGDFVEEGKKTEEKADEAKKVVEAEKTKEAAVDTKDVKKEDATKETEKKEAA